MKKKGKLKRSTTFSREISKSMKVLSISPESKKILKTRSKSIDRTLEEGDGDIN